MKSLLAITAVLEGATGIALLLSPPLVVSILLGAALDAPAAHVAGRIGGAALFSLAIACWLARDHVTSHAARGVVAAMVVYNVAATAVLGYAGVVLGFSNLILWSAVVLHAALAAWCVACLRAVSRARCRKFIGLAYSSMLCAFCTTVASTAVDQPNISMAVIASKPSNPFQCSGSATSAAPRVV